MTRFTLSLSLLAALVCVAISQAAQPYLVSDRAAGILWRIEDTNGDGDALDVGERIPWADGLTGPVEMETLGQAVYAVESFLDTGSNRIMRLEDLTGDGDALDIGERTVWADGLGFPWGLTHDGQGSWFVSDAGNSNVLRLADLNGDGDVLDVGETTLYAEGITGATSVLFDSGGLFVTAFEGNVVHRVDDRNHDGDALDVGENLVVTASLEAPVGLLSDGSGGFFFSSYSTSTVYHAEDRNQDGDFFDMAEVFSYADNVFGGLDGPVGMTPYESGGFLLADFDLAQILWVHDNTGDGDGLDFGEVTLFADGFMSPIGIIALPEILVGDYNGDGKVSAADYTVWRDHVGAQSLLNRDPANDGPVGPDDFDSWIENYGNPFGSGVGAGAIAIVPEPGTIMMLLVAGLVCARSAARRG
jgi:hypothetical protein